ncbi:GyrI-like domain-containing protein [Aquimarina algiphila]|uniref:GyrI-like domain-containing protein n=1 Tax=Aquimarina algiphila TaxID=2047982 RepID=UPI00232D1B27|nr:GyrI-like domain-containing protein [Aquimarina algiphila]
MKKVVIVIVTLLFGLTIWYLYIKKYDYEISFKANAAPGSIYDQVKNLRSIAKTNDIREIYPYESLQQKIVIDKVPVILEWNFKSMADTITKVEVGIVSQDHSLENRLKVLIGSSKVIDSVKSNLIDLRKKIMNYTDSFMVVVDGESESPEMEYISVSSKTKRYRKANEMMRSNAFLYPKLTKNDIQKDGFPFVNIKNWDTEADSIYLDFGFPIKYRDSLPVGSGINVGKIKSKKALKATYHGNYRNSDEAWFVLLTYAKKNNILVEKTPLEIFYNNPMQGGDELEWKAEIFLPIKDELAENE